MIFFLLFTSSFPISGVRRCPRRRGAWLERVAFCWPHALADVKPMACVGIELSLPDWEASVLTTTPRPLHALTCYRFPISWDLVKIYVVLVVSNLWTFYNACHKQLIFKDSKSIFVLYLFIFSWRAKSIWKRNMKIRYFYRYNWFKFLGFNRMN